MMKSIRRRGERGEKREERGKGRERERGEGRGERGMGERGVVYRIGVTATCAAGIFEHY